MSQENIATLVKILESLPETKQDQVIEHLKEYIADIEDELRWKESLEKKQSKLVAAARLAREQIAQGLVQPMDNEQL